MIVWRVAAPLLSLTAAALYAMGRMPGHMLAHLILSLLVPAALLAARPDWRPRVPALAGFLALATVTVVAHLPRVMMGAQAAPALLAVEGGLFFAAGLPFALVVWRADVAALVVVVAQMAVCALTGAWVAYGGMGSGAAAAGTLMWVGGGLLYMTAGLIVVARLVGREGDETPPEVRHVA
ncbi:hypothetical protein E7T09_00925 [Deinococcus sp. KSM4-11]|uniref:hypothetical protein n=1 Tax=Deinococcus sp. KSM4-11 TaxID=2568654 RepID=UPI0010A4C09E|nr:hypothetical protein [Deinococcus sp. KSM4-11]THF87834.1 hypothetical protein E7T09_00925 [Deinococcus sp. KSM4-11]